MPGHTTGKENYPSGYQGGTSGYQGGTSGYQGGTSGYQGEGKDVKSTTTVLHAEVYEPARGTRHGDVLEAERRT